MSAFVRTKFNDNEAIFMVDTGSEICIAKSYIINNTDIDQNNKIDITGVTEGSTKSLGTINENILIEDAQFDTQINVVEDNFPTPGDGIIGLDFILKHGGDLNFRHLEFSIVDPFTNNLIYTPIMLSPNKDEITIPARSEVIRRIKIQTTTNSTSLVINHQEIAPGVIIASTLINTKNPCVRILNINSKDVIIRDDIEVEAESLDNYHIFENEKLPKRTKKVMDKLLRNFPKHPTQRTKSKLEDLFIKYADTFALDDEPISCNNFYEQKLRLKDDEPVYIKNYRIPHTQKPEIKRQVDKLVTDELVEKSSSDSNSPLLLVSKKPLPGSTKPRFRLVFDYRKVNDKLVADKFPLPRMDEILDSLGKARHFSVLDLYSGFHQVGLHPDSRDITSFSTDEGSFRFTRLPYGLKVAPNSFQRMMTMAFSGLPPQKAFVYMDDLVVISSTEQQMLQNLESVFQICRSKNLKLNPEKCLFFQTEVTYLGHRCTNKGLLPDPSKIEKIKNYPEPRNAEEIKRFVAFANYYRKFVKNFAHHASHLTNLTKKKVEYKWSEECQIAFEYLKDSIMNPPILQYPDFEKQFCVTTDASKIACGAILSQDYNGIQLPIAFASRSFTKGEQNKSVIEQELAAIHWAINHFRPYLFGTKFLVKSDHRPLVYLFSMRNPSSKLTRMRLDLEEFNFEIQYVKGKDNSGADALSRIDFDDIKLINKDIKIAVMTRSKFKQNNTENNEQSIQKPVEDPRIFEVIKIAEVKRLPRVIFTFNKQPWCTIKNGKTIIIKKLIDHTFTNGKLDLSLLLPALDQEARKLKINKVQLSLNDELFSKITIQELKMSGQQILRNLKIALTPKLKYIDYEDINRIKEILQKYHDDPIDGGHAGAQRLLSKLRMHFHWKNMSKDVLSYVKACAQCQKNKTLKHTKEKLTITNTPQQAFDIVQIDTIGPFIKSNNGYEYAVTIICTLTKYLVSIPIKDKRADTIARAIMDNFVMIYGPMKQVLTDQGTEYKNETVKELLKLLKIDQKFSTAFHHETIGVCERSHRTLNEYLRAYIATNRPDWDKFLLYFTYAYNTTPSTVHSYCPYELIFAKSPTIQEFTSSSKIDPIYNVDAYYQEMRARLQTATSLAKKLIEQNKTKQKAQYDKTINPIELRQNDLVLLRREQNHKHEPLFDGPYQIIKIDQTNCLIKDEKGKTQEVHKNRLRKFNSIFFARFLRKSI